MPQVPTLYTYQVRWEAFRRITGFYGSTGVNIAITKNAMTVGAGGIIADALGNVLNAPLEISAGQVIYVGQLPSAQMIVTGLNIPVNAGETVYVSKNQANIVFVTLYFDYD